MLVARNQRHGVTAKPEKKGPDAVETKEFLQNVNGFGGGGIGYERR